MTNIWLVLIGLLVFSVGASAFQLTVSDLEGNLSQGARDLAGSGITSTGASGACNSQYFSGDNCGMYVYGLLSILLLNLVLFRLAQNSGLFLLLNMFWLYTLDAYQLIPSGVFLSVVGILGGIIVAWALWRLTQAR